MFDSTFASENPMDDIDTDQETVMAVLDPYLGRMEPLFSAALDLHLTEVTPKARAELGVRAVASVVSDHAWAAFEREFDAEPGFHFLTVRGLKLLNIRDQVVIRLKKVDENGKHQNADTGQQRAFDAQEDIKGLPPAAARLVLGYQPDEAFSKVERVIIRRPKGRWVAQVIDSDTDRHWVDITPAELPFVAARTAKQS